MLANHNFHTHLRQIRKQKRMTQFDLVEKSHISVNNLYNLERPFANPTLDTLVKLAKALDVKLDELVFGPNSTQ